MPKTSLNQKTINYQKPSKISKNFPAAIYLIKTTIKAKESIGPYKNTNKFKKNILKVHINQHTIALKILAFVNQFSSFDYHQFV